MGTAARFDGLITAVETGVAGEGQREEGRTRRRRRERGGRGRGRQGYVRVLAALISL